MLDQCSEVACFIMVEEHVLNAVEHVIPLMYVEGKDRAEGPHVGGGPVGLQVLPHPRTHVVQLARWRWSPCNLFIYQARV